MTAPVNISQAVKTVQQKGLLMVNNFGPVFNSGDKEFDNFQTLVGQVGSAVSYMKQARSTVVNSLVWAEESYDQRIQNLVVNQPFSASIQMTNQEFIFNVQPLNWDKSWAKAAIINIAASLEAYAANDFTIYPYRYYGDGNTPITNFLEINTILMRFRNFGSANVEAKFFIPDFAEPSIVQSGLNQFAPDRNNGLANSWELGTYSMCKFMRSNQLQRHIAGTEGQQSSTLTVVSTTKNAAGQITSITFSGCNAANDANSIKKGDRLTITTAGTNLLQFVGTGNAVNPIQFMASSDAASTGSSRVTVTLSTPLYPGQGISDAININTDIIAGMTAVVANSHVAACIYAGNAHQIANPQLPDQDPFPTSWQNDPLTGASMRVTAAAQPGQGTSRIGIDTIVGSTMNPDLCMAVLFPLSQG